jgi:hypothetical protein
VKQQVYAESLHNLREAVFFPEEQRAVQPLVTK